MRSPANKASSLFAVSANRTERRDFATSRVGEHHIDVSCLSFHGIVESIQIGDLGDITLHSTRLLTQEVDCLTQLRLSAVRNEDRGPFRNESLCGSESDPARATGYDSNFPSSFPMISSSGLIQLFRGQRTPPWTCSVSSVIRQSRSKPGIRQ